MNKSEQRGEETDRSNAKTFFSKNEGALQWVKDNAARVPALPILFVAALSDTVNKRNTPAGLDAFIEALNTKSLADLQRSPNSQNSFIENFCKQQCARQR